MAALRPFFSNKNCFFLLFFYIPFASPFFFLPFISRTMVLFARQYSMIGYLAAGHSVLLCWNSHCCCRFRLSVYGPFTIEGVTGRCQIQFNMLGHTVNVFACVWGLCILPNLKMWATLPFFLIPCHLIQETSSRGPMSRSFFSRIFVCPFSFFFATITITFVKYLNGKNYNSKLWCVCYATYLHSYTNDVTLFDCFFFVRLWVLANEHSCFSYFFVSCFFLRLYLLILKCREREWRGSLWFFGDEEKNKSHRLYCPWCGQLDPSASRFRVFFVFFLFVFSLTKKKATGWEPPPVVLFFCKLASRPPVTRISNDVIDPLV